MQIIQCFMRVYIYSLLWNNIFIHDPDFLSRLLGVGMTSFSCTINESFPLSFTIPSMWILFSEYFDNVMDSCIASDKERAYYATNFLNWCVQVHFLTAWRVWLNFHILWDFDVFIYEYGGRKILILFLRKTS